MLEVPDSLKPEELNNFFLDVVRSGGLNVEPLAETIDRLIDEDAVRRSPIRFGLVMTELGTMRRVQCPVEKIPEGQMKDYLLGSSACFPALRPREIDGVKYIDGGWRDNMPLDLAAAMGAGELLAVDVNGVGITRPNTTGLPTRIIRSHWNLGPTLDFAPERAARNIALGYFDTMRLFDRMGGTAYRHPAGQQRLFEELRRTLPAAPGRGRRPLPSYRLGGKDCPPAGQLPGPLCAEPQCPHRGCTGPAGAGRRAPERARGHALHPQTAGCHRDGQL